MAEIFLLGHRGFVGSGLARYFKKNNIPFVGIDRENYSTFAGKECDIFINAGGSSKKRLAEQEPRKDFDLNVVSALNTVMDFRFKKYILLSSIDVYNDVTTPKNNRENSKIDPERLSNYGFGKWLCEQIIMKHCGDWLIVRLGGMVGEGLKKNAIYDLKNSGTLYVNPLSEYQYMNTEDVAKFIYTLRKKNGIFNVCGDGVVRLKDIADKEGIKLDKELARLKKDIYKINIAKLKKIGKVPKTKTTIENFLRDNK